MATHFPLHAGDPDYVGGVRMGAVVMLALAMIVALSGTAANAHASAFSVGVVTHFGRAMGDVRETASWLRETGVTTVRDEMYWWHVEVDQGVLALPDRYRRYVAELHGAGLDPLLVLDYGNRHYDGGDKPISPEARVAFARYCGFVAEQTRGQARMFEIWNEWDSSIGGEGTTPGTADTYVALAKECYQAVKTAQPDALVLAGAMTTAAMTGDWLRRFLRLGGMQWADALSVHTYVFSRRNASPELWLGVMRDTLATIEAEVGTVPVYVTEMGWPTATTAGGVSAEVAADYLARTLLLARTLPQIRALWWYETTDAGSDPANRAHGFGLVRADGAPKPALAALRDVGPLVAEGVYLRRLPASDPDLWLLEFERDGVPVLAMWHAGGRIAQVTVGVPSGVGERVTVRRAGVAGTLTLQAGGTVTVDVGARPTLVTGRRTTQ